MQNVWLKISAIKVERFQRDPQDHKGSCHVVEHLVRFLHGCKEPHKPLFVHSPGDLGEHAVEDISAYGVIYTPGRKF